MTGRLLLVSVLFAQAACIPTPQPSGPGNGDLVVGADYTHHGFGHWACPETDVVVANPEGHWLIHELSLDYVVRESEERSGHRLFTIDIGGSPFLYDVPPNPADPMIVVTNVTQLSEPWPGPFDTPVAVKGNPSQTAVVHRKNGKDFRELDTTCPAAPMPTFIGRGGT